MLKNGSDNTGTYPHTFFPPCVRWLYFIFKSTDFHDIRAEFHRINNSHSLPTLLLTSHKSPEISWFLPSRLFPNHSPVWWICYVKLLPLLRGCRLEPSFKYRISCFRYLISEWTFKNISHWRTTRLTLHPQLTKRFSSSADSRENSLSTDHPTKSKRSKLPL